MRTIVATLALILAARGSFAQSRAADEAAIRAQAAAYETALNQRDGAAVAALYTADGDFVYFDSPAVVGRQAIADSTRAMLAEWSTTMRFTLSVTGIRFVAADVAIVDTEAHFSEGEMRTNRGTSVAVRVGGKWLLAALRVYPAQRS